MDADAALAANSTGRWLLAAGVAVAVTLLLFTLRGLIASRLKKFAGRTSNEWDDTVSEVVAATRGLTIAVAGIVAGTMVLALDATALNVVSHALVLALLLQAGFWGTALAKSLISRWRRTRLPGDPAAASTLGIVTFGSYLLVWAAVVLLMLDNVGVNITALVAGLGIGGVA